jgi:hypothetical protein
MILTSGVFDMFSTVLIVGKTAWAYPWIATELFIIVTKVIFCIEPLRFTEIRKVRDQTTGQEVHMPNGKKIKLPLEIQTSDEWHCHAVDISSTTLQDCSSSQLWVSQSPGVYIGQPFANSTAGQKIIKYLAFVGNNNKIGLVDDLPAAQGNLALQREFLAAVAAMVVANKVPSKGFIAAVDTLISNIKENMDDTWYKFGAKETIDAISTARKNRIWRIYI